MAPDDLFLFVSLNGALVVFGFIVLAYTWSLGRDVRHLYDTLVIPPGTSAKEAKDHDLRWKALAWLVSQHGFSLKDVKRFNFQANVRDRLTKIKTWNELLPVGGFFGTVAPLAWFFYAKADTLISGQLSLAKAIIPALGTALLTTVIGMFWFWVIAFILARVEERLGEVERGIDERAEAEFARMEIIANDASNGGKAALEDRP